MNGLIFYKSSLTKLKKQRDSNKKENLGNSKKKDKYIVKETKKKQNAGGITGKLLKKENIYNSVQDFVSDIKDSFLWSLKKVGEKDEVFYSENILDVTGYTGDEIKHFPGRGTAIVLEEDLQKLKKLFSEFVADSSQQHISLIYRIIKKDKNIVWIKESVSVKRNSKGKAVEFFGIVTDVTQLKEDEISAKDSLERYRELNSTKDKFISMLSHDLRAPFTSILGFSEILLNEPNLSEKDKTEYLNFINGSSQSQLHLINYLLDWSRLQTGRMRLEPERLHAQTLVFNCISSLTGNAVRKNIDIKILVKDSLYIRVDERLLTLVITNLLNNSIKFSREGQTVEIQADIFNDQFIEFVVKDEGIGISEKNKVKLFRIEKMYTTEGTKGERGTGLGLSLVKEIVEKHGGEIWFYSEQGKGSEFHFTVPSFPNTILLIENNKEDKRKFERMIRENFPNYDLLGAPNGYEALGMVYRHFPSLIITENEMPLMSGIQFVESIRREDRGHKIPIIAIAMEITNDLKLAYQNFGINTILQKPVAEDVFNEKVQTVLDYSS